MSTLREELQQIYHEHRTLSPRLVVDTARPDDHPLHHLFQWDDAEAAERFRLVQAAQLIRSVKVVYREDKKTGQEFRRRAYVSTAETTRPSEYLATEEALADPLTRKLVLRQFERSIAALKRQYGHLKEYDSMLRKHGLGEDAAA
jgi:hypothetical protein